MYGGCSHWLSILHILVWIILTNMCYVLWCKHIVLLLTFCVMSHVYRWLIFVYSASTGLHNSKISFNVNWLSLDQVIQEVTTTEKGWGIIYFPVKNQVYYCLVRRCSVQLCEQILVHHWLGEQFVASLWTFFQFSVFSRASLCSNTVVDLNIQHIDIQWPLVAGSSVLTVTRLCYYFSRLLSGWRHVPCTTWTGRV